MKIPVIKKIVEENTIEQLVKAEIDLLDEKVPDIDIEGHDEGEKLTHIMAGIWILNEMNDHGTDFKEALRLYTKKVRESIS